MEKIKAVIFDMDGVLVDSEPVVRECMKKSAEELSLPFEDEYYELFLGCNDEMTHKILKERYHDDELVNGILKGYEYKIEKEYADGNINLKPGCKEVISFLQENNIPYALATGSSYSYVEIDFLKNGYKQIPFEYYVTGDKITHSKPNPEIFLKAAELMKLNIKDCLIVEDSPKGVEAAYASGTQFCLIPDIVKPTSDMIEKATYLKKDLFELIDLIKEIIVK